MQKEFQDVYDDACSMPARNLRITWKTLLAFWILFVAVCCLRASAPGPAPDAVRSQAAGDMKAAMRGTR